MFLDLIEQCEFDTIYHQHLCYFSLTALSNLFDRHGMSISAVGRIPIHGGSLRFTVGLRHRPTESVASLLALERAVGANKIFYFTAFADRVSDTKHALKTLLNTLKKSGATLAGFGAAAKANTLLSHAGIDRHILDFVVDSNPAKQGLYMGGNHPPIVDENHLRKAQPDYLLILAWNFVEEITSQLAWYQDAGGRFIIPIPLPQISTLGGGYDNGTTP